MKTIVITVKDMGAEIERMKEAEMPEADIKTAEEKRFIVIEVRNSLDYYITQSLSMTDMESLLEHDDTELVLI